MRPLTVVDPFSNGTQPYSVALKVQASIGRMGGAATAFVGIGMSAATATLETPSDTAKAAMSPTDPRERPRLMLSPLRIRPRLSLVRGSVSRYRVMWLAI